MQQTQVAQVTCDAKLQLLPAIQLLYAILKMEGSANPGALQ